MLLNYWVNTICQTKTNWVKLQEQHATALNYVPSVCYVQRRACQTVQEFIIVKFGLSTITRRSIDQKKNSNNGGIYTLDAIMETLGQKVMLAREGNYNLRENLLTGPSMAHTKRKPT